MPAEVDCCEDRCRRDTSCKQKRFFLLTARRVPLCFVATLLSFARNINEIVATQHFPALGDVHTVRARKHAVCAGANVESPFQALPRNMRSVLCQASRPSQAHTKEVYLFPEQLDEQRVGIAPSCTPLQAYKDEVYLFAKHLDNKWRHCTFLERRARRPHADSSRL